MKALSAFATLVFIATNATAITDGKGIAAPQDTIAKSKRVKMMRVGGDERAIVIKEDGSKAQIDQEVRKRAGQKKQADANKEKKNEQERIATYPGGDRAIREYVRKNTRYPAECKGQRIAGRTVVSVTIRPDGTNAATKIEKSSGNRHMDAEALRVVRSMPKWSPAKNIKEGKEHKHHISVSFRPGR